MWEDTERGLLALQRGTVVVLREDEGRQASSHHSHELWPLPSWAMNRKIPKHLGQTGKITSAPARNLNGRGRRRSKRDRMFSRLEKPHPWGARGVPAIQWESSASSLFSLDFTSTNLPTPSWCQLRGFKTKLMIWGCTMKMFKSEKRWVFYKENETTLSLLGLGAPQGGRCLTPGFWHPRHEDHRRERAVLQTCTLNPKYICLMGVWNIQEFQQNAC